MYQTKRMCSEGAEARMNELIQVHELGSIMLVDYSGNDEAIARAARHSYGKGTKAVSEDETLIRFLRRHDHTSPFEQAGLTFDIKLPLFINQQWIRHRTASLNQVSGRYSIMEDEFYYPDKETMGKQSPSNKQGTEGSFTEKEYQERRAAMEEASKAAYAAYEKLLADGVSKEQARIVLPTNLYTRIVWRMDLHNLMHFLRLRMDPHAQQEIRDYANEISSIFESAFPIAYGAFNDYLLNSMKLTWQDQLALSRELQPSPPVQQLPPGFFKTKREETEYDSKTKILRSLTSAADYIVWVYEQEKSSE